MKRLIKIILSAILIVTFICVIGIVSIHAYLSRVPDDELWRITKLVHNLTLSGEFLLFESSDGEDCACVYIADKTTGDIIWSTEDLAYSQTNEDERADRNSRGLIGVSVDILATSDEHNIVFVSLRQNSTLFALDITDGHTVWGPVKLWRGGDYEVLLSNDVIYILDDNGSLLALDVSTGKEFWNVTVLDKESHAFLKFYERVIFVTILTRYKVEIIAYSSDNGEQLWVTDIRRIYYGMTFAGNTLFVETRIGENQDIKYLEAINLENGIKIWEVRFEERGYDPIYLNVVGNQVFLIIDERFEDNDKFRPSKLVVLNSKTGDLLWEFNETYSHGDINYFVSDGIVNIGTRDGYVFALDSETGDELWKLKTPAIPSCFTVDNDLLIVVSKGNYLLALDRETGLQKWFLAVEVGYLGDQKQDCFDKGISVRKKDGFIYVAGNDRVVHLINIRTGEETWSWIDLRFPEWRPIPYYKPSPYIELIDGDIVYIVNGGTLSGGLFALHVEKNGADQ